MVSAASNIVFKIAVDPATGAATVQSDPSDPTRVLEIPVGKNPAAWSSIPPIRWPSSPTTCPAISLLVDLTTQPEKAVATVQSAALPAPGTVADLVHVGKELYNTSIGVFDPAPGTTTPITGRMSNNGWGACATCHPNGLTDNVVWIFPSGPKKTISQHTDFDLTDPERKSSDCSTTAPNETKKKTSSSTSGLSPAAQGLIVQADGVTQDPTVVNLTPLASANRNQLKVHGLNAWDGIKAYIQFGIRRRFLR